MAATTGRPPADDVGMTPGHLQGLRSRRANAKMPFACPILLPDVVIIAVGGTRVSGIGLA